MDKLEGRRFQNADFPDDRLSDFLGVSPSGAEQLGLFSSPTHTVSEPMDRINDRWGEFVVTPALMMGMEDIILDRISFGGVKELREIYE
jgi:hypothetical protein